MSRSLVSLHSLSRLLLREGGGGLASFSSSSSSLSLAGVLNPLSSFSLGFVAPATMTDVTAAAVAVPRGKMTKKLDCSSAAAVVVRGFARSSSPSTESSEDKARTFLLTVGYDRAVSDGMITALRESGLSGEALLSTIRSMAGRWEVGEDEGLEDLAGAVKERLAREEGRRTVRVWVVPPNAWDSGDEKEEVGENNEAKKKKESEEDHSEMMTRAFPVEALSGTTLTDVAKFGTSPGASTLGEYIECACSGIMACSTCHVVIDTAWFNAVGEPCEAELDMLDLAYGPRETSRLGCQVVLTEELDGMVVKVPGGANNLMDFIPFEE